MAATKRKICKDSDVEVEKKRATLDRLTEDRLSDLPEALQLRILACLDTKHAVQTTSLSKNWVNVWTRIPGLDLNYVSFNNAYVFEPFVEWVLSRRDYLAKLDGLKFNGNELCSANTLKKVFDYAFSYKVKQLEVSIIDPGDIHSWPLSVCDSLTSLKLQVLKHGLIRCPVLGSFKNLSVLYLIGALVTDIEAFSGFPVLESLTLLHCDFWTENRSVIRVQIHSLGLLDLTISGAQCWELRTPRLRFLDLEGLHLLKHEGLPVLETLKINLRCHISRSYYVTKREKRLNDDLMSLFSIIPNVKSITLFSDIVLLLSLFHDELVRCGSPFQDLKDLTLYINEDFVTRFCNKPGEFESVKAYLLGNSPHANFTIIPLQ